MYGKGPTQGKAKLVPQFQPQKETLLWIGNRTGRNGITKERTSASRGKERPNNWGRDDRLFEEGTICVRKEGRAHFEGRHDRLSEEGMTLEIY